MTRATKPNSLITEATNAFMEGKLDRVVELGRQIMEQNPEAVDGYDLQSIALLHLNRETEAANVARAWLKAVKPTAKAFRVLLEAGYLSGDREAVSQAAQGLSKLENAPVQLLALGAAMSGELGDKRAATRLMRLVNASEEVPGYSHRLLAWARITTGDRKAGIDALERMAADEHLEPTERVEANALLALEALESGDFGRARATLDRGGRLGLEDDSLTVVRALVTGNPPPTALPESVSSRAHILIRHRLGSRAGASAV